MNRLTIAAEMKDHTGRVAAVAMDTIPATITSASPEDCMIPMIPP